MSVTVAPGASALAIRPDVGDGCARGECLGDSGETVTGTHSTLCTLPPRVGVDTCCTQG